MVTYKDVGQEVVKIKSPEHRYLLRTYFDDDHTVVVQDHMGDGRYFIFLAEHIQLAPPLTSAPR